MRAADVGAFKELLTAAMAFYRRDVSEFALEVWWQACKPFSMEQVSKALTRHATDPDRGTFPPMPADIVRVLQGTHGDRALVAWSKAYGAIGPVGSYTSVVFDDPLIHAVVEDMGGWPKFCRGELAELQFQQKRFCDTYRAYSGREDMKHPPRLMGVHEIERQLDGYPAPRPAYIGDAARAMAVEQGGVANRLAITQ